MGWVRQTAWALVAKMDENCHFANNINQLVGCVIIVNNNCYIMINCKYNIEICNKMMSAKRFFVKITQNCRNVLDYTKSLPKYLVKNDKITKKIVTINQIRH